MSGQDGREPERSTRRPEGCLTDAELVAFAEGTLGEEEREMLHLHLDACEPCQDLFNEAVKALDPALSTLTSRTDDDFATTFRPGTIVGERYRIVHFLARGAMGEVYEAYDQRLNERIALKAVSSAACDSQRAIRNLIAEVGLARRVTHPNVCRIYDLGTHVLPSGATLYFLTMEFVDGKTLGHLLRRNGAFPLDEALRFARALLQGLGAAHAAGILHRDFKSDNVMMRTDASGRRTPVILDFGLASTLDERSRARSTQEAFVGTLSYMAPEQVEGHRLSKYTDVYAFGVVWFEMLTGKLPFPGPPQLAALKRLSDPPGPPSQVNPVIPPEIDAVVTRCLARIPEQRFQSAEDVLAALPPELGQSERPPQPSESGSAASSRSPVAKSSAIALVAGVALAGALAGLLSLPRTPPPRKQAPAAQPLAETRPATETHPPPSERLPSTREPEHGPLQTVVDEPPEEERPRRPGDKKVPEEGRRRSRVPPGWAIPLNAMPMERRFSAPRRPAEAPAPTARSSPFELSNTFKKFELKKKANPTAASAKIP